jgi:hypothetical protein
MTSSRQKGPVEHKIPNERFVPKYGLFGLDIICTNEESGRFKIINEGLQWAVYSQDFSYYDGLERSADRGLYSYRVSKPKKSNYILT